MMLAGSDVADMMFSGLGVADRFRFRFFIIRHIHNHTSIISSEMQVELKKNTAFT